MEKLIDLLKTKLCNAKFYKNVCNNEITEQYIKEAKQIFEQIIGELK